MVWRRRYQSDTRCRIAHFSDRNAYFVAGKLPTLAGLGALCYLYLQFIGVSKVVAGYPEAARRYLFYCRAQAIAVRKRDIPYRVLAALTGIGFSAEAVHRDSDRLMRLLTYRPETHGAGHKTLYYLVCRLLLEKITK